MNKHLIIISIGRLSQMIIMFLTYRLLTNVLSVADMGNYYFLLSISGAFGLVFANPLTMYTYRMLNSWKEHKVLIKNLDMLTMTFLVGSLLTIPIIFFLKSKFTIETNSWLFIIGILVFYLFSASFNTNFIYILNLLGLTNHFVIWTIVTNLTGLGLSLILVKWISPDPLYWLLGQAIAFFVFGIVSYAIIRNKFIEIDTPSVAVTKLRAMRVLKFALPIVITNVFLWVFSQSFRFFYKENIDATILGELAFGIGLSTALCVAVEYLFNQLYLPGFYDQISNSSNSKSAVWNKFLNKLVPLYVFLTFYIIGLAPFIMRVLADTKFKNSGQYLALGAGVDFFRMVGNIFMTATQSEMKTHKAIGPYLVGGIITLSGILFISHHPEFVSYTVLFLMLGYLATLVCLFFSVNKMFKVELEISKIIKCIFISLIFLTALFFSKYSDSLVKSILINAMYGIFLLYLMYRSYNHSRRIEAA